jgi:hypothetical protein
MKKLIGIFLIVSFHLNAQTLVPAGSVSGTWNTSGSPYLIQGGIFVPNGSTLTIQPGVTVNFQNHYKLLVLGRLLAVGTANDSIYFTAADTSAGWYGIRFDNTASSNDTSRFSYCSIKYGKANGSGNDAYGGAFLFNNFSKVVVANCRIFRNTNYSIYCVSSSPRILNNTIHRNSGGAITNTNGSVPKIIGNLIANNYGAGINGGTNIEVHYNTISFNSGVGIFMSNGGTVTYNTISHNNSSFWGGGIYISSPGTVLISHNIISYNICTNSAYGGGIFCYSGNNTVTYNIITNNQSASGAGIYCLQQDPVVSNNLIANNTATGSTGKGGGILCYGNNPSFTNNTIVNNSAPKGGGIYFGGTTTANVVNCILYGNTALDGNEVYLQDQTSAPNFDHCDIEGGTASFGLNGNVYLGNFTNNISSNPNFVSPASGSGVSFPGQSADWSLLSISPCINSGNAAGSYPLIDLAGNNRIFNSVIDIGAYEFQGPNDVLTKDLQQEVLIYPNPSNGTFFVINRNNNEQQIQITDVNGKQVYSEYHKHSSQVDVSFLMNGVYTLICKSSSTVHSAKIVIIK